MLFKNITKIDFYVWIKLTLKCISYFSLPFMHKGILCDPTILKYFPVGIWYETCTMPVYA